MIKKDNKKIHSVATRVNRNINMKYKRSGATLISSLIAISIILIAVIGTSNFRYYAAMDTRKATAMTEASRIALLLCESWRGLEGDLNYDPISNLGSDLIINNSEGSPAPSGFTTLGNYLITLGTNSDRSEYNISYYTTLSWQDLQPGLRALNANISWAQRDTGNGGFEDADKSFSLTIYTLTY
ncbi:MAG: hypothetical protein JXA96_07745 [Sedimentisphaerales bacterium]|nr:hypothetical protein [Sedimentisphaerales bacterium]